MMDSEKVGLIKDACHTGFWGHVLRRVLEDARDSFTTWHDPGEWSDMPGALAGYQELTAFDQMHSAIEEAVMHGSVAPSEGRLAVYADAYDYMLRHGGHQEADKSAYARHFRDVIVVECIRCAGTHCDAD